MGLHNDKEKKDVSTGLKVVKKKSMVHLAIEERKQEKKRVGNEVPQGHTLGTKIGFL